MGHKNNHDAWQHGRQGTVYLIHVPFYELTGIEYQQRIMKLSHKNIDK